MSRRREQLESSLKRAIGQVLVEGLADPRIRGLVSVTEVSVSPDGRDATVKVSILPAEREPGTLRGLEHAAGHIQTLVDRKLRTRSLPQLHFKLDRTLKKQAEVLRSIREAVAEDEVRRDEAGPPEPPDESVESSEEPSP